MSGVSQVFGPAATLPVRRLCIGTQVSAAVFLLQKGEARMSNAEIFRVHADDCRLMARFTHDENRQSQWLDMERRWRDLIERAMRHDTSATT
jgi:hypothetical protein